MCRLSVLQDFMSYFIKGGIATLLLWYNELSGILYKLPHLVFINILSARLFRIYNLFRQNYFFVFYRLGPLCDQ